ncbi:hypothetical protein PIB30_018674 [Stylosanthes scabra]|uniref:DUF4283 domain-containing protein n=1 Tax=Stylosanthes scabra TaxID=79078 RepID=A0ABU6V671_9FABA|nr:hypothetical protein [Stylosanthes scabra]
MGIPVVAWSKETFERIASQWGKLVLFDDHTEFHKLFSVACFLIDSFEWVRINEWIDVKVDGQIYEAYVCEYGIEVYSMQSHPCSSENEEEESDGLEDRTKSRTVETSPEVVTPPPYVVDGILKLNNVGNASNPALKLNVVLQDVNDEGECNEFSGDGNNEEVHGKTGDDTMNQLWKDSLVGEKDLGSDGLEFVAQIKERERIRLDQHDVSPIHGSGKRNEGLGPNADDDSLSSNTSPYPPGFGPGIRGNYREVHNPNPCPEIDNSETVSDEWVEAVKARSICELAGISFKTSNEGSLFTLLARTSDRNRNDGDVKKQRGRQWFFPNNIKGRSLSTRFLRSGAKPKSK